MRTTILLFVCCLSWCFAKAQDGFYLQAQCGTGVTHIQAVESTTPGLASDGGVSIGSQPSYISASANLIGGYEFHHMQIATGVQAITTEGVHNARYEYFPSGTTYFKNLTDEHATYTHILVPVSFGFRVPVCKKWSVTPEVSAKLLFLSKDDHASGASCFCGKVSIERKINSSWGVLISPAYYRIKSPVRLNDPGSGYFNTSELTVNKLFMVHAGVSYHFHTKTARKKHSSKK